MVGKLSFTTAPTPVLLSKHLRYPIFLGPEDAGAVESVSWLDPRQTEYVSMILCLHMITSFFLDRLYICLYVHGLQMIAFALWLCHLYQYTIFVYFYMTSGPVCTSVNVSASWIYFHTSGRLCPSHLVIAHDAGDTPGILLVF